MNDQQLSTGLASLLAEAVKTRTHTEELVALMREQNNITQRALKYAESPVNTTKPTKPHPTLLSALNDAEWRLIRNFIDQHSDFDSDELDELVAELTRAARAGRLDYYYD